MKKEDLRVCYYNLTETFDSKNWIKVLFHRWFTKTDSKGNEAPHALYEREDGSVGSCHFVYIKFEK